MRGGPPPPIIFERLKLPQQIIYRRKENLSESPNHQKYWENILVSRFYEQFSRNRRNLGHFRKFEKISISILFIYYPQNKITMSNFNFNFVYLLSSKPNYNVAHHLIVGAEG